MTCNDLNVTTSTAVGTNTTYDNVAVTNGATLTFNAGASIVVNNLLSVDTGATLKLDNASLTVGGVMTILGTLDSNNGSDTLTLNGNCTTASTGSWIVTGQIIIGSTSTTTYGGGTVSGSGTVTVDGTLTISTAMTWNPSILNGSGTLSISSGITFTLGGALSVVLATS